MNLFGIIIPPTQKQDYSWAYSLQLSSSGQSVHFLVHVELI